MAPFFSISRGDIRPSKAGNRPDGRCIVLPRHSGTGQGRIVLASQPLPLGSLVIQPGIPAGNAFHGDFVWLKILAKGHRRRKIFTNDQIHRGIRTSIGQVADALGIHGLPMVAHDHNLLNGDRIGGSRMVVEIII